jgi:ABC-type glutathione transport system ATPase component
MIVVTHEMAFAREAADRVYFMEDGHWVEVGPPEQVVDDPREAQTRAFLARFLSERRTGPTKPIEEAEPAIDPTLHPHG